MTLYGCNLASLITQASTLQQVLKSDLLPGDYVFAKTCNSVYSIRICEGGLYSVSGGWFDRKGISPANTNIIGCTWGGSAVKVDIVAACGLSIEFSKRLKTSPVIRFYVFQSHKWN